MLLWTSTRPLQVSDFKFAVIDSTSEQRPQSSASIGFSWQMIGYRVPKDSRDWVKANFAQDISFIDPAADTLQVLRLHQIEFDIFELYARQMRQLIKQNRKEIDNGEDFQRLLDEPTVRCNKRIMEFRMDTDYGRRRERFARWQEIIAGELEALKEFGLDE